MINNQETPTVSIGMTVYNSERYLEKSIRSLLAQDYKNLEIIICDNSSEDSSQEICLKYANMDSRISYHRNIKNIGPMENFKMAYNLSAGKYFMWNNAHDYFGTNFISECVEALEQDSSLLLCFGKTNFVTMEGEICDNIYQALDTRGMDIINRFKSVYWASIKSAVMFYGVYRSEIIKKVNPYRKVIGNDLITLAEIALRGNILEIEDITFYRQHTRQEKSSTQSIHRWLSNLFDQDDPKNEAITPWLNMAFAYLTMITSNIESTNEKEKLLITAVDLLRQNFGSLIKHEIEKLILICETEISKQIKNNVFLDSLFPYVKKAKIFYENKDKLESLQDRYSKLSYNVESFPKFSSEVIQWEHVRKLNKIKLYAGDLPDSEKYDGLIGLSITKNDDRHILHDVTKPFPLLDNSVDSFQAEDVFEHISYKNLPAVFDEIFRVLKPSAVFRLSVPDYGCDVLQERSVKDKNGKVIFDPGGGGTIDDPGHLWYPIITNVQSLLENTKFSKFGKIDFLHYYMPDNTFVLKNIDYSKGFVMRNPDNDKRVQNPRRPMSLIVDLTKEVNVEEKFDDELHLEYSESKNTRNNVAPKLSFVMIVLNGMPFIEFSLKAIYEFAHEIIIVEGAVEKCLFAADPNGSSTDGTIEFIKTFSDPGNKIRLVQGRWPEKLEMQNKALEFISGDYVWLVDSDEVYKKNDIAQIIKLLVDDPSITQVNFIPDNFWKGFDHIFVSSFFFTETAHYRRVFKYEKGAKFINHRPPTMVLPGRDKTTEQINLVSGTKTRAMGIYPYHYSYVFDEQVKQKLELYKRYGWTSVWNIDIDKWYNEGFLKWSQENKETVEEKYAPWTGDKDSRTQVFSGEHPEVIREFKNTFGLTDFEKLKNKYKDQFNKSIKIIGSVKQQQKVLDAWKNIELDNPLMIRKDWITKNVAESNNFWNIHVALSYTSEKIKPKNYLEVGVRTGGSLVQSLYKSTIEQAKLVDLWSGNYANLPNTIAYTKNQLERFMKTTENTCSLEFNQGNSHIVLKKLIEKQLKFDLINIDGDHEEEGAWEDLMDAEKLLADKGAILFDDIIHPIHKYILNFIDRFLKLYPEFNAIVNAEQDNGCAILLKNISIEEFLGINTPRCNNIKIAGDYAKEKDLTEVDSHSSFSESIYKIFSEIKPQKIIETGTYLGKGTTKIIVLAIMNLSLQKTEFYSIEINPDNFKQAKINLYNEGLLSYVELLNGVSVPRNFLPTISEIKNNTVDNVEFENIFVDHKENERADLYFKETDFDNVPEDLLGKCLRKFDYKPDFILLDSGGHMGYVEFQYLINLLRSECYIALDDIYHIKHHKSFLYIQDDPRFKVIVSSKEKFGFCIAKFTPLDPCDKKKAIIPDIKKIIFLRTDSIGDNVLASTLLKPLKNKFPEADISVICQEHVAEIYDTNQFVYEIIKINISKYRKDLEYRKGLETKLAFLKADLLINSIYSRTDECDKLAEKCRAKVKIAFEGDTSNIPYNLLVQNNTIYTSLIKVSSEVRNELERFNSLLEYFNIEAEKFSTFTHLFAEDKNYVNKVFSENNLTKENTICLGPYAQYDIRDYSNYQAIIKKMTNYKFLIIGAPENEERSLMEFGNSSPNVINLTGKTTLKQLISIIENSRLFIGAESAGTHIACAVGTPNVVVMGGGHFGRFMPYSELTSLVILPLSCYGCNWQCQFERAYCVKDVDHELIVTAVENALIRTSKKTRIYFNELPNKDAKIIISKLLSQFLAIDKVELIAVKKKNSLSYTKKLLLLAEEAIQNNHYSTARKLIDNVLYIEALNVDGLNNLAVIEICEKKYAEAVSLLKQILELDSMNVVALGNLAYLQKQL